jgi:hypothetical protein
METPITPLETAIADARAGKAPVVDMLRLFARSDVLIPSNTLVHPDGRGLTPLQLERDGHTMTVCFTDQVRMDADVRAAAPYQLRVRGDWVLRWLPADRGLAVNPGTTLGFDIPAEGLRRFLLEAGI